VASTCAGVVGRDVQLGWRIAEAKRGKVLAAREIDVRSGRQVGVAQDLPRNKLERAPLQRANTEPQQDGVGPAVAAVEEVLPVNGGTLLPRLYSQRYV